MLKITRCFKFWKSKDTFPTFSRHLSTKSDKKKVCIVGSGPAGFYTAQHLLKNVNIEVDIFEKLPVPFGLIRYGVAPDHPDIKNVINSFTKIASNERCHFYGNVNVGRDVNVSELLDSYNAVVLAFGASCDKALGIPGENSNNVMPARKIVGWYTGHPDFVNERIDLDTEVAAVIGHGNVALDVARILLKDPDELKSTDIAEHAYEALKKSRIKRVVLVGRRGPLQVSFTIKEFREMTQLSGCCVKMHDDNIRNLPIVLEELVNPYKRLITLMNSTYMDKEKMQASDENLKCLELKFCRNPKQILPDANGRVAKLVLTVNDFEGTYSKDVKFKATDIEDVLECGMVIRSVGYQSAPIDPLIPFDENKHIIPNKDGRVLGIKGLYCSGWVKTGPVGVILSTMYESFKTGEKLLHDLEKGELPDTLPRREDILNLLKNRGVSVVTFKDWKKIDKEEIERGKMKGKSREIIYSVEEMLAISAS